MSRWHRFSKLKFFRTVRPLTAAILFAAIGTIVVLYSSAAPYNGGGGLGQLPSVAPNPVISTSNCAGGLNIAILADVSGSIYDDYEAFSDMQAAMRDFVSALLPSTRTKFSVTQFDDQASVMQAFTNNVSSLDDAINRLRGGGGTNWAIGLQAAYGTFSDVSSSTAPRLLIIATDGDPTDPRLTALQDAMNQANTIKNADIHILAIGIGPAPQVNNLENISGTRLNTGGVNADVMTTDVSQMDQALQDIARYTCGSSTGTTGTGNGGTGTGTGTGGTGTGSGGTGTGTGGKGTGSGGTGTGTKGTGTGTTVGKSPQPSPSPAPSKPSQNPTPSPQPSPEPNPDPTPAPQATVSNQPNPAPTPTAQGTQTKPPDVQPSPFFDGKQYAPGSTPDNFAYDVASRTSHAWVWLTTGLAVIVAAASFAIWHKKQKPAPTKASTSRHSTTAKPAKKSAAAKRKP